MSITRTAPASRGVATVVPGPARRYASTARHAPRRPARRRTYPRVLVIIGFWAVLATSAGLWAVDAQPATLTNPAGALTAAGRLAGLLGGSVLMLQVLVTSRVSALERAVGTRRLMRSHRYLGVSVLVLILSHVSLIISGYALSAQVGFLAQAWGMLPTMTTAFAAAGTLVAVAFLAIRWIRRLLPYELWHATHLATYAILFLAYGHQFAMGTDLQARPARWFWIGLYALTAAGVLWGRVLAPLRFNLRHRLRVVSVVPESADTVSIYLEGRHLHRLNAHAGQFFRWRFLSAGGWWQSHPFSLSSAPNGHWLRLTVHATGGYTRRLGQLSFGTRVLAAGPFGQFIAARRTRDLNLFIAGGSGIAPIRALLDEMPFDSILIYRASRPEQLVFRGELERLAAQVGVRVHYVVGRRADPWPRYALTFAGLTQLVPDVQNRDVYLCGPPGLVDSAIVTLRYLGVPNRQIHLDPFEL